MGTALITKDELYQHQKQVGDRRGTGDWCLQSLKPRHFAIIALSTEGKRNKEIAEKLGLSEGTVSRILNDPLVEEYVHRIYHGLEQEMRGLAFLAIDAIREILNYSGDRELKLKAVDRFEHLFKTFTKEGREAAKPSGEEGKESEKQRGDVIERLVEMLDRVTKPTIDITPTEEIEDVEDGEA